MTNKFEITYGERVRNKQTFLFNGVHMARVHFRQDGSSVLYVYNHCILLPESQLNQAGFVYGIKPPSMSPGGSLSNYQCVLIIKSGDIEFIAQEFSRICKFGNESHLVANKRRNMLSEHTYSINNSEFDNDLSYISDKRINREDFYHSLLLPEEFEAIETNDIVNSLEGIDKLAVVKSRVNQGAFRELLIKKFGCCCLCGADEAGLLIASHIKPWADSTPKERVDVSNGLLLCPNHDRLFDKGYISFDSDGKIMISSSLNDINRCLMNVHEDMKVDLTVKSAEYMEYHRKHIFGQLNEE